VKGKSSIKAYGHNADAVLIFYTSDKLIFELIMDFLKTEEITIMERFS